MLSVGMLCAAGRAGAQPTLPEVGQTFDLSLNGFGARLVVDLPPPLPTLNFIGSRQVQVVDAGADQVGLRILNMTAEAVHPLFGKIVMRADQPETDLPSVVRRIAEDRLGGTWYQSVRVTFEKCVECPGPFIYHTRRPAEWTAELTEFPPPEATTNPDGSPSEGALYRLAQPIGLTVSDPTSISSPECETCPLTKPLPGREPFFAIIEELHWVQGRL